MTGSVKSTGAQLVAAFPPRPVASSWPATGARRSAVVDRVLAAPFALDNPISQRNRRLGVLAVLGWLREQPGDSWQQRWRASGAEDQPDWRLLVGTDRAKPLPHLTSGLLVLICADVIRPSLDWLLRFAPARHNLAAEMARTRDRAAFAELTALCQGRVGLQSQQQALTNVAIIMAVKGGNVAAVRVGDCLELLATAARTRATNDRHAHSPLFYQLLRAHGDLGPDAPAAIEMFFGRGQPSCEQLIDRYRIACRPVRDVLVDYLRERQPAVDFSTLQHLAYLLGKLFWADLEAHHPGIDSLQLPRDVAAAWKQRVLTRPKATTDDGQVSGPRLDGRSVLTAVRAFYLDLAEWADDDPARWGPWAVRCPVSASDASHKKARSHRKSRMDTRTRERLPVLPTLVAWVAAERARTAELLAAAEQTRPGEVFTAAGTTLRRAVLKTQTTGRVWAEHPDTGAAPRPQLRRTPRVLDLGRGRGVAPHRNPHRGTDRTVTPQPHPIPAADHRGTDPAAADRPVQDRRRAASGDFTGAGGRVVDHRRPHPRRSARRPLVVSYDKNERVYNPPMPLLFQWRRRLDHRAVSETVLRTYLDHALTEIGVKDAAGQPMRYTFHDFRRLFITDAIAHGMPPHIAQLVAGHRDINTTMGYKAVYPEEVINGHRAFIARRRALRPTEEYRTPTDAEWAEFVGHFQRRKVAIGDCGRSYDTPCIHEHSCLRCPLLRPDPAARARLEEIRDNLLARIAEAESHRWYGEAEGLKVSLAGANAKLAQMDQISASRTKTVQLGIPSFTDTAGRTTDPADNRNQF